MTPLVLITGASSGIGAASARVFADAGYRVILVARSHDKLEAVAKPLGEAATVMACDLGDPAAAAALAARVAQEAGPPDVIVHCAGGGAWKRVEDTPPAEAMEMTGAPYLADFVVTSALLPEMLARGSGVLIHVNSPAAIEPWPASAGYAAARHALLGLHKALLQDLRGSGVQSCHVIFGHVDTPYIATNGLTDASFPLMDKALPTLRPEACAQVLLDLSRHPRPWTVKPALLRMSLAMARVFPGFARWLLRF